MSIKNQTAPVAIFVSNNCWSLYNFRREILHRFSEKGWQVVAIAPKDEFTEKLMTCCALRYYDVSFRNSAVSPLSDLQLYRKLLEIYRMESPNIIFHYVTKPVVYGSLAAGRLGIPSIAVITGLGYVYASDTWLSWPVTFLFRRALRHAAQVWFLNRENAGFFTGEKIIPHGKSLILPGEGIDTGRFKPAVEKIATDRFVFLMVSRLLWSKGVGVYMEAAAILKERGVNAEFRLLGRPEPGHPEAVATEQLIVWEKQGLLVNLGCSDDVPEVLATADCFVLPTFYEEGIPRSLMEASSMELPVIASDHTGCNSLVEDGVTGLLCRPRDARDLAQKMTDMLNLSPRERMQMGKAGREKMIRNFDIALVAQRYQETADRFAR